MNVHLQKFSLKHYTQKRTNSNNFNQISGKTVYLLVYCGIHLQIIDVFQEIWLKSLLLCAVYLKSTFVFGLPYMRTISHIIFVVLHVRSYQYNTWHCILYIFACPIAYYMLDCYVRYELYRRIPSICPFLVSFLFQSHTLFLFYLFPPSEQISARFLVCRCNFGKS